MSEQPPEFRRGNASFRAALARVVNWLRGYGIDASGVPGWSRDAFGFWRPPTRSLAGAGSQVPSFTIRASGSGVTLADGKVHISAEVGALSVDITPQIGSTLLSAASAPVLALTSGDNDIYMKVELVPASEQVPNSSPAAYRVGGYSSVAGGSVDVTLTKVTQAPAVSATTGAVVTNLISSWYIGSANKDGDTITVSKPQNRYGPITIGACGSALSIYAPVFLNLDYDTPEEE